MQKLIVILGATATGKTALATHLADELNGEIISADSRQVYRGMDIGTGKDLKDYLVDNRAIPYHLIDIANPGYEYNVYAFQKDFLKAYDEIESRNRTPILCGGTGLYIDSVVRRYEMNYVPVNEELRNKLEHYSDNELVGLLKNYGSLHNTTDTTDRSRTIRAIEIEDYQKHGRGLNEEFPDIPYVIFGVYFEREVIRQRITERLEARIEEGLVEEVKGLLENGLTPEQLSFYGLEYRFVTMFVTGKLSEEEMFQQLNTGIHQFAKRQMTWFRRMEKKDVKINWIDGNLPLDQKLRFIKTQLELHK